MVNQTIQQNTQAAHICWLDELDRNSLSEAGGKGANLGEMIGAGLPVPSGFVVRASVYRALLQIDGLGERITRRLEGLSTDQVDVVTAASQDIAGWIEEMPVPAPVQESIIRAYGELAGRLGRAGENPPVAVRSSATAEDLPGASFAGQQETFLNVCGPDQVIQAVRKCWASLWTPRAISYRSSMGFNHSSVALAVVVQTMVPAEVAGVMFTSNPVSGARDELLVSASYGLGESVVSGSVTPDTFVLGIDGSVREQSLGTKETQIVPNGCGTRVEAVSPAGRSRYSLTGSDFAALAALAGRVQDHFGVPQDTEWAISAGKLYLLQSRPITRIDSRTGADSIDPAEKPLVDRPPRGIEHTIDHIPEPPMPLDIEFIGNHAFDLYFAKLGMKLPENPTGPVERPDGRIGLRFGEPRPSPALLWKIPAHIIYVLRRDPMTDWQPLAAEMTSWVQSLEKRRQAAGSAVDLAQQMVLSLAGFDRLFARRYQASMVPGLLYGFLLNVWARRVVGKTAAPELEKRLLQAVPYPTALQNQAMTRLAGAARDHGKESREFKAALDDFLAKWGDRPVRGMVPLPSSPTWSEQPAVVVDMLDALQANPEILETDQAARKQEDDFQNAKAQVQAALSPLFRRWFLGHLERARRALVVREEGLSLAENFTAFVRRAALQMGDLLAAQGVIDQPGDVFYLLVSELVPAAQGSLPDARTRVERRKQGYGRLLAAHAQGRHWLIATGSIPPLENRSAQTDRAAGGKTLTGLAASRGEAVGPVRVIRGPEVFGRLRKGEILVAPFTAPAWTPLFHLAAAVVTDIGSLSSHAAIVAREYGIPSIVAVSGATHLLKDGQIIHVDGARGIITLIDAGPTAPTLPANQQEERSYEND